MAEHEERNTLQHSAARTEIPDCQLRRAAAKFPVESLHSHNFLVFWLRASVKIKSTHLQALAPDI